MCSCWVKCLFFKKKASVKRKEAHCTTRDARNFNSEKNQIMPRDHIWFPSILVSVSEHDVLSINLIPNVSQICLNEVKANSLLASESFC